MQGAPEDSSGVTRGDVIMEDEEENSNGESGPRTSADANQSCGATVTQGVRWAANLLDSAPHWEGWFSGLSDRFLSLGAAKLLLLAGVDRLDTALTVGQMQGKF